MKKAALFLLLFQPVVYCGTTGDNFLILLPFAKIGLSGFAAYELASESDYYTKHDLAVGGATFAGFFIPNSMLLYSLFSNNAGQTTFWRKFLFYEELLFSGYVLTSLLFEVLNNNEDIGPPGELSDNHDGLADYHDAALLFPVSVGLAGMTLLNLIPYSIENNINVSFGIGGNTAQGLSSRRVHLILNRSF